MIFAIAIANVAFIFAVAYWLNSKRTALSKLFWPALILKLLAGIVLGLIYRNYYVQADTFCFYEDAVVLAKVARTDPLKFIDLLYSDDGSLSFLSLNYRQPRALFFVKIVSLFNLLTADNYWVTSLYFSCIAFCFTWRLVTTLLKYFPSQRLAISLSFLFLPSVVFWSSGILKESLVMSCIYFITNLFIIFWMKGKIHWLEWMVLPFAVVVFWQLKYYYAAIFMPILIASIITKFLVVPAFKVKKPAVELLAWILVLVAPLFLMTLTRHNLQLTYIFKLISTTGSGFVELSSANGAIHYYNLQPNVTSFIINSPWALFSGLFRPFVWEVSNPFRLLAAVENLVVLLLTITSLQRIKNIFTSESRLLILSIITYTVLLCVFLALSTPNFGTLSRYRIAFLPFFVFLVSYKNPAIELSSNFMQRTFSRLVR